MTLLMKLRKLSLYRDDPKPIPARTTRRLLVVVISTLMVATVVLTAVVSAYFALFAVLVLGPVYLWFAYSATRFMTFTKATALLDEWQREQLFQAQRTAFTLISAVLLVLGLVLANLSVNFGVQFAPVAFDKIAWLLFLAGVYLLPWTSVAVLAWRLPDEEADPVNDELIADGGSTTS